MEPIHGTTPIEYNRTGINEMTEIMQLIIESGRILKNRFYQNTKYKTKAKYDIRLQSYFG